MANQVNVARASRGWRWVLAATTASLGCNAIFNIDDPQRAPQSCVLSSDCPAGSGQVCVFARCSPACHSDVDCGSGQRCLETELGTACVNDAEARCEDGDPNFACPRGTVCFDGACYGACSVSEDCTDGRACENGACKGELAPATGGSGNAAGAGGHSGSGGDDGAATDMGGAGAGGAPVMAEVCGDGEVGDNEVCDDGDVQAGDGCDSACAQEQGWLCDTRAPSRCEAICGDGLVLGAEAEAGGCDDGDVEPGDGCSATCKVEPAFVCFGQPSVCARTCGNGQIDAGEGCDDSNDQIGDGCASCAIEPGYQCDTAQTPSKCEDVNECATATHDCNANANCTNTVGSFECKCKSGFTGNGRQCVDVDECAKSHDCHEHATCMNTPGSYSCVCKGGLTGNGKSTCSFSQLVGGLDGRLVTIPCAASANSDDCAAAGAISNGVTTACVGGALNAVYNHPIAGPAGVEYTAALRFQGILGPKNYGSNIAREAGTQRPDVGANPSLPAPFATSAPGASYTASNYGTAELRVFNHDNVEIGSYFLNSDTQEGHYTFAINYQRPIRLVGGGFVRLTMEYSNCRIIKNCGGGGFPCAAKARSIDVSAANPQPAGLLQPGLGLMPDHSGQWLLIDVTAVTPL